MLQRPRRIDADGPQLLDMPARTEAEIEPPLGHMVQRRDHLGERDRGSERRDQYAGRQPDLACAPGDGGQRHQRVGIILVALEGKLRRLADALNNLGQRDMFAEHDLIGAGLLGNLRHIDQPAIMAMDQVIDMRQKDGELSHSAVATEAERRPARTDTAMATPPTASSAPVIPKIA